MDLWKMQNSSHPVGKQGWRARLHRQPPLSLASPSTLDPVFSLDLLACPSSLLPFVDLHRWRLGRHAAAL